MTRRWFRSTAVALVIAVCCATAAGADEPGTGVDDGAAITPEFARGLFDRVKVLNENDHCHLVRFDTSKFRITIGLEAPSGTVHAFDVSTARAAGAARSAGAWSLGVNADVERECGRTVAAIASILGIVEAPRASFTEPTTDDLFRLLAGMFIVLVFGTALVLRREARRAPRAALLALAAISVCALVLRLSLSPRTFLHEYYHIAETVPAYLSGRMAPLYGQTGPALFRLVAGLVGQPDNVQVIFLTNAVLSALAVPALALLDLALIGSWPRALCAAALLSVLPLHLRFSAAEDLFVQATTLGLWSLALFALYARTGRVVDALLTCLALALAMQVRPEMMIFPGVLVSMLLFVRPQSWRVLFGWRTLVAGVLLAVLLVPRFIELQSALGGGGAPGAQLPDFNRYVNRLVLLQPEVTPLLHRMLLCGGLMWGLWQTPSLVLWVMLVFVGYTLSGLALFDNPPYNLRAQILPSTFAVLIMASGASLWLRLLRADRQRAVVGGATLLAVASLGVVVGWRGFITELRDQQLEWAFLERTVPQLPERATLLTTVEVGGSNLNAFPQFLLSRAHKAFEMIDLRGVVKGESAWPEPDGELIFYQGMFCYFSLDANEPLDPMTDLCQSVHARYRLEPMFEATLDTKGYSHMYYAPGPYRLGFFRLHPPSHNER